MTIQQILKEAETVSKIVSEEAKVTLEYTTNDPNEFIKQFARDRGSTLFKPCSSIPYYFTSFQINNINVLINGKKLS